MSASVGASAVIPSNFTAVAPSAEEEEEVVVVVVEVEVEVDERVEMTGFWSLCRFLLVTSLVRWLSSSLLIFVF